ncbi:MAG: polysaccharide deacetylase family protein [Solirubrobacterales bacterium]
MSRVWNLTFHGVGEPLRPFDEGEEAVWISLDRLRATLDALSGRPDACVTVDDGNASDRVHMACELRSRGLRGTFFVTVGRLGEPGFLTPDEVRELVASGMGVGSHGMAHRDWRHLDDAQLDRDLREARDALEAIVGTAVTDAACPFGSYDRRVLRSLRRAGYRRVYTSDGGPARPDAWLQARTTVTHGSRMPWLEEHRAGMRPLKRMVKRWR